jgi:biopolymer transport protein ExbD
MKFRKKSRNRSTLPFFIAPLVNLVFLFLIFFLIIPAFPLESGKVGLPGSMTNLGASGANAVTVIVLPEKVLIDGKPREPQTLASLPRDKDIVILGSPKTEYLKVIKILDILRTSGHTRLSLATKPMPY